MDELFIESANWYHAATLRERVASLRANQSAESADQADTELAARRMQLWRAQAPFAAGSQFAQRLATDGLSEDDLLYCLGETVEVLHRRLGGSRGWLEQLVRAFSRPPSSALLPLPELVRSQQTAGFLNLIEPLLRDALERMQTGADAFANSSPTLPFDTATVAALLFANLPQQLLGMLSPTLVLELNVARLEGLLDGTTAEERFHSFAERLRRRDAGLAILEEYPVLARQLVVHINHWVDFSLEFLRHLVKDWELLRTTFTPGDDPGVLVEVGGDVGDSHRGGRCVLINKFSSGLQIVYKPRTLSVDVHFQELLAWMNERGDHPPFQTVKILDEGDYGWMEFVAPRACGSEEEVRRFYERQGAYLALLYALEATDFHFENLVADGEHPILLDLEALFHPHVGGIDLTQAEQLAGNTLNYSVLRVGLLPNRVWSNDESAGIDLSGLGSPTGQLSPQLFPRWEGSGTDEMRLTRKRMEMPGGHNRPTLNGTEVNLLDYTDAIVTGFNSVYGLLLKNRDELLSDQGPLAAFDDDEVRAIMRPTQTYAVLLRESFHPDVLRDGLDRDRLFDHLWAAVDYCRHLTRVIAAEHEDLRNGDIPIFSTRPNSRDLWTSSRQQVVDFFDEPGIVRARRRIQELGNHDFARQLWFIRASLATLSKAGDGSRRPSTYPTEARTPADRERLLSAARGVGDRLEELALRGEQGVSWIGLTLANQQDWFLTPLRLDLYDGLPGVALFLGYLGKITGESRYMALANAALSTVRRKVERNPSSIQSIGGFDGVGGVTYALMHLGVLWDQPDLLIEAEAMVERLPALIEKDERFDLISGAAGCLGSLLAFYQCVPSQRTLAAAVRCGDHLLAHAQTMQPGLGWLLKGVASKPLAGFSHGVAGIGWALLELAGVTGEVRFRATALAAIEYERSLFSLAEGNWPDLRDLGVSDAASDNGSARFAMLAWCHGAPGIGLARILCLRHVDDLQIRSEIKVAIEATLARGFGNNHSLCHGDLGNLELLLEASLTLGEPRWRLEVNRVAAIILESIDQDGWLCGNPLAVESPGLMTGLAGIGYELLRLADPTGVPSVLALAPPKVQSAEAQPDCAVLSVAGGR